MSAVEAGKLLNCPMCGSAAEMQQIEDEESDDFGAYFIQCSERICGISTHLYFACGDDPKPLLIEVWNRRANQPEGESMDAMAKALKIGLKYFGADPETAAMAIIEDGSTLAEFQDAARKALDSVGNYAHPDTERLDFIASEYLRVDCFDMPTGQGDADVGWRLEQQFQQAPHMRVIACVYKDDLRACIDAAIAAESKPDTRDMEQGE